MITLTNETFQMDYYNMNSTASMNLIARIQPFVCNFFHILYSNILCFFCVCIYNFWKQMLCHLLFHTACILIIV